MEKIEGAGIQILAISYDSVDVLKKFADRRKIIFPLLSDPKSQTIKGFGVLNSDAKGKGAGIPYPGTFILDKDGVVRAKIFVDGYRERHSLDELLKAAATVK